MDCCFIKARVISRSNNGRRGSAVSYVHYLAREPMKGVNYADKGASLAHGIIGAGNMGAHELWLSAEHKELDSKRRATAQYAKEYILGLPEKLNKADQQAICKQVAEYLAAEGRVVDWYFHEPDKEGDSRNWHCYLMMSTRSFNGQAWSKTKKSRLEQGERACI